MWAASPSPAAPSGAARRGFRQSPAHLEPNGEPPARRCLRRQRRVGSLDGGQARSQQHVLGRAQLRIARHDPLGLDARELADLSELDPTERMTARHLRYRRLGTA